MFKNKKKRGSMIISAVLSLLMISGSFVFTFADTSFSDLNNSPYKASVEKLSAENIISGYPDGSFRPEKTVTRAEACVMISRAMNPSDEKYAAASENRFSDVNADYTWAKRYINYAYSMGVVDGYPDGTFRPSASVTYNELAAMIIRGMGYSADMLGGSWPDNYKNKAVELEIYDGIYALLTAAEKQNFDYKAPALRGNTSLMIYAALDGLREQGKKELPVKEAGNGEAAEQNTNLNSDLSAAKTLSLSDAVRIMKKDSYLAKIAQLNYETDKTKVEGYAEDIKDIKSAIKSIEDMENRIDRLVDQKGRVNQAIAYLESIPPEDRTPEQEAALAEQKQLASSISTALNQVEAALEQIGTRDAMEINKKIVELQQDFAAANLEGNHLAEQNSIEYQTVSIYYGILQAKENVRVSRDSLAVQEELKRITDLKYSVGTVAKMAVQSQNLAVENAEQDVRDAETSLSGAIMSFNMMLGYDLTTNMELTDTLTPLALPSADIDAAVESAMNNRLSALQLKYACDVQKLSAELLRKNEGKESAAYKKQLLALELTETSYNNLKKSLELEIRNAYMSLCNKLEKIQQSRDTVAIAEEGLRLAEVSYKAGTGTLADVQKAQVSVLQSNQMLMATIADYNLSVYEFGYLKNVGKERIEL